MSRWPIRQVSRDKLGDRALSDKVHKATLHTMAGRAGLVASEPHWEQLRTRAREARVRALDDHDGLLARFCDKLEARGVGVTVAKTPAQACEHITRLVLDVGIRVTKSKSMTSERGPSGIASHSERHRSKPLPEPRAAARSHAAPAVFINSLFHFGTVGSSPSATPVAIAAATASAA
ncbi:MAG: hypothetical protein MUF54_03735 [Polyangiaceae bacterium]|nr:hypothetical protein [Polyangiaceae bacterium]